MLCTQLCCCTLFAQKKLPVIYATTKAVAIRDGDMYDPHAWTLSPATRPDVYTAERTRKNKYVTFYTNTDSIRVKVKPGSKFDFIILLNGKDSCYTRIESAIPPEDSRQLKTARHDTIPFTRTSHEAISVRAVLDGTDTVTLHFDTGSWDVRLTKDAIVKKTKLLAGQGDYMAGKAAPNFNKLRKVQQLQIGSLVFHNPNLSATDLTAHDMDGRFGWNLFDGKQVELDYDNNLLIVHSGKLPKIPRGYVRSALTFRYSFLLVEGAIKKGNQQLAASFLMDTGAESAIILDSAWAAGNDFARELPLIKTIVLTNPRGIQFKTQVVQAPALQLNGFELKEVPALILGTKNPAGFPINNLGNDVLKRFNMILDFRNDLVYWKPNSLFPTAFRTDRG
jgi:hypothetical protein